ncbi:MAG: cryptochrome/photolyase family protein [Acidimicrobiales bacterium]
MTTVIWFRRDLRLADHPAVVAAHEERGSGVLPLFVLDDNLLRPAGPPRLAFLARCLADLHESTGGHLVLRQGDPAKVVAEVAKEVEAESVYVSADYAPYGRRRDQAVDRALEGVCALERVGSPYTVDPGELLTAGSAPYRVFTPYYRAWREHGWGEPSGRPEDLRWVTGVRSEPLPAEPQGTSAGLPPGGEAAAHRRLDAFLEGVIAYGRHRDRVDLDTTSRLSPYLRFGCLHPRQALSRLGRSAGAEKFRTEMAWRDFYADVLFHRPESSRRALQPAMSRLDVDTGPEADARFEAWARGRTGYPFVDAGMRQLLAEGWMPNRARMVVASFLVKDLHIDWTRGARWFMRRLVDGDLASNQHNWQWVAGTGTDPSPFFRIFNPVIQGTQHDPTGDYVRRWVPELAGVDGVGVHRPWRLPGGPPPGYPAPIVDHGIERKEALARYSAARRAR